MHERRTVCRCLDEVDDRTLRARFELELHELGRVLGSPCILRDDHRDGLADVAHDVPGEERL